MSMNTVFVESSSTTRGKLSLSKVIENTVDSFLKENNGRLEDYVLSGTVLEQGHFGRTLITIKWSPESSGKKKEVV